MKFRIVRMTTKAGNEFYRIQKKILFFWSSASFGEDEIQGFIYDSPSDAQMAIDKRLGRKIIKKEILK